MTAFLRMIPVLLILVLAVPLLAADRHTVPPAPVETFTTADAPTYQGDGEWTIPWGYNRPENAQRTYPLVVIGRHNESRYFTTAIRKQYPAFYYIRTDLSTTMNTEDHGRQVADIIDARMTSHGYRIDTTRMYMTGWSAGGNTTYRIANGLSSRGKCFAALIRIAGQDTLTLAPATNGRISVWYHIGLLDTSNNRVGVARGHYTSIKNNLANAGAVETTVVNDNLIGLGQLEQLDGGGYGEWFNDPDFGGHGRQTTKSLTIDGVPFARLSEYDDRHHETEMAYADPDLYAWLFARGIGSGSSGPIGLSVSSLSVPEGSTATFTVVLNAQPAASTTVTVARTDGDASITVSSGATLTFTTANWSTPQTVTLAAAQDGDYANGTATITVSAAGLGSRTLCAIEADDDTFGIALGNNALSVREGTTATVAVWLSAQPLANTTVTIQPGSGDTDLSISGPTTLIYTPANWQTPQYFTIAAAQDADTVNGTRNFNLYISGTSINKTLLVSELDDDAVGLVMNTAALSIPEGSTATFTVALSAQPAATTTVTVARTAGDTDITVSSGSSLTFTTANWSTPQTVTLAAAQDADLLNGTATISISAAGLTSRTLTVIEVDDDAGSVSNTAPTISAIADQSVAHNTATGALAFTIGDAETTAGSLTVTRTSSNTTLVPVANIVLGGSGANRTVTVTPATGQSGTATIAITVSDGSMSAEETFLLTVAAAGNTERLDVIQPAGSGSINGYQNIQTWAFDSQPTGVPAEGDTSDAFGAGGTFYCNAGRGIYIDFGEEWESIVLKEVWMGLKQSGTNPSGTPVSVWSETADAAGAAAGIPAPDVLMNWRRNTTNKSWQRVWLGRESVAARYYIQTFDGTQSSGNSMEEIVFVGEAGSTATGYSAWVNSSRLSGPDADPGAMPFLDGAPNLIKYALGLPGDRAADSADLPTGRLNAGSNTFEYSFLRSREELDYIVESTESLSPSDWRAFAVNPGAQGEMATVSINLDGVVSRFLRLKVIPTSATQMNQ